MQVADQGLLDPLYSIYLLLGVCKYPKVSYLTCEASGLNGTRRHQPVRGTTQLCAKLFSDKPRIPQQRTHNLGSLGTEWYKKAPTSQRHYAAMRQVAL